MLEVAEKLVEHALQGDRTLKTSLPRAGRATLRRQPERKREVLHLLHATPVLRGVIRGDQVQPIQDLITLNDVEVSLRAEGKVRSVKEVPTGKPLTFRQAAGRVSFKVPTLRGTQWSRSPIEASRDAVGWAKARQRRAHASQIQRSRVGTALARLCPPYKLEAAEADERAGVGILRLPVRQELGDDVGLFRQLVAGHPIGTRRRHVAVVEQERREACVDAALLEEIEVALRSPAGSGYCSSPFAAP